MKIVLHLYHERTRVQHKNSTFKERDYLFQNSIISLHSILSLASHFITSHPYFTQTVRSHVSQLKSSRDAEEAK